MNVKIQMILLLPPTLRWYVLLTQVSGGALYNEWPSVSGVFETAKENVD